MRVCPACNVPCDATHRFCPACGYPVGQIDQNAQDPLVGRVLPGGYVVLELIGVGGMGRVYRGEQQALGRTVAVKVIHQHLLGEESTASRFITEARAASRLNHPNSVGVIDFGKSDDGQLYMVMEYLRGRDLGLVLHEEGPLPFARIVDVLRQVLAALGEAHELGIIHRDLKPENVILERVRGGKDFVKVVDFGLAKLTADVGAGPGVTRPGIVCGTPDFMAPEQGRGDAVDFRADLYSLGVTLFLMLTGKLPFEADSPTQVVLMHLSVPPPDPRHVAPTRRIPRALAEVCLRALAKSPGDRYQDADQMTSALVEALAIPDTARPSNSDTVYCAACGHTNAATQKFCGECGLRLLASVNPDDLARIPIASTAPPPGLASGVPSRRPVSSRVATAAAFPLPLTERDDHLGWLEDRRAEVRGALRGARIVGDDGVGKSRLLQEFLTISRLVGDAVTEAGPDPWWADVGYYALRQVIGGLTGLPDGGGASRDWPGAAAEARRGLLEVYGLAGSEHAPLAPESRRYLAAEALRWALARGAQNAGKHRVIIAIDDLHRVDGASRNAFADALAEPPIAPVLLVATHVAGFDPGWGGAAVCNLAGLPAPVAADLLQTGASALLATADDGSGRGVPPMYIEQLVRFTHEGGSDPPPRLVDILALRVERLPTAGRRVLQALAVVGDAPKRDDLVALLPESEAVDEGIASLLRAGMIAAFGPGFAITHPLVREVVVASIPAAVRRELHAAALARVQEGLVPIEARALHALHAQDIFEALLLLEQVASLTASRGDLAGSVLALRRALDLARREFFRGELDDPAHAVVVFSRKLGEALTQMGNLTDADGVLREALDLADRVGPERARVLIALARVASGRNRAPEAMAFLHDAIDSARRSGAHDLVPSLEAMRAEFSATP